MDFDAAIKEAQERLADIDKDIKLVQWEVSQLKLDGDNKIVQLREKGFQVVGEIAALTKLKSADKAEISEKTEN